LSKEKREKKSSLCATPHMLEVLPKKELYAIFRLSILKQGTFSDKHVIFTCNFGFPPEVCVVGLDSADSCNDAMFLVRINLEKRVSPSFRSASLSTFCIFSCMFIILARFYI
jgi:hypothetical protein